MKRNQTNLLLSAGVVGMFAASSQAVVVVDDSFADGITNNGPGQIGFNTTSSNSALDLGQAPGPLDFATGSSGRVIHGLFEAQTLTNLGESLELVFDFTTPTTVDGGSGSEDFRFGLYNTATAAGAIDSNTGEAIDFAGPIASSSGSPNTALNGLAGFFGEIDNINQAGSDLGLRTHNVNNTSDASSPGGQFQNSTTGFDFISGGADDLVALIPNTDYSGRLLVEFNNAGEFDITVEILDASGSSIDSHTDNISIADIIGTEVGVNTDTFDLFVLSATSGAFGSNNATGDIDNGIDISNVTVTFNPIPEPGSLALLSAGVCLLVSRRRAA